MSKRSIEGLVKEERPESSNEMALKVMSIMMEAYGALPRGFWGLFRSADLLVPRGYIVSDRESFDNYCRRIDSVRSPYPIINLKILWWNLAIHDSIIIIPGVKTVSIGGHDYDPGSLPPPEGIEEVTFCSAGGFNRPIHLPPSVRKLELNRSYNYPLTLPCGLTEISFSSDSEYNYPLILPESIKVAVFGSVFNQLLTLGPYIEELKLGCSSTFDQPIDLSVAQKLRVITFGHSFNRLVIGLPASLEEIEFGYCFSQPVVLPPNLRKITFGKRFACPVKLPPRLEELLFNYEGDFNSPLVFPENSCMKILRLSDMFNQQINLPEGLETVIFGDNFNRPLTLPSTLRKLHFNCDSVLGHSVFNQPIDLPSGIKTVAFAMHMQHLVVLPVGVEDICWFSNFPIQLPDGLIEAYFGPLFQQPLALPSSLKQIIFEDGLYNLPLTLPAGCCRIT